MQWVSPVNRTRTCVVQLQCGVIGLARTDTNNLLDGGHEDLSVTDQPSLGRFGNGGNGTIRHRIGDQQLQFDLGQERHIVFGAAINLSMPLLATEPLDLAHRQATGPDRGEGRMDVLEFTT
jgi:hypothetical protein